jgi:cytochrome oxidase assembly protein ShyY1
MASRFWVLARTPRWIAALLLALAIAAGFAALGQWQLGRSIDNATVSEIDTETAVALTTIAKPDSAMTDAELGRTVAVRGDLVDGDFVVLTGRNNGGSATGTWLVGHLITDEGISLAVALGWSTDAILPPEAVDAGRSEWVGRYLPSEGPQFSDFEHGERTALSVPELVNLWDDAGPVYAGYLVLADPAPDLEPIIAHAPVSEVALNLLNVFYAIEWVLFAGFAIYLWYRLVRDAVERTVHNEAP